MKNIHATIITIGDELLIGQVIDTNSAWMAQRLNEAGITVKKRIAIGDEAAAIKSCLDEEIPGNEILLLTGGLGPTSDDITKQTLCEYFKGSMTVNEEVLQHVKYLFEKIYKKPVSGVNLRQAEVPDVCEVIQNRRGSAPCMVFRKGETIIISMAGVPYEMEGIMEEAVPYLAEQFQLPAIIHRTILTAGIGETALAELISDFEKQLPPGISLAYLPSYGMVRLRLSTTSFEKEAAAALMEAQFSQLRTLVASYLVNDDGSNMQETLGRILTDRQKSLSTAESCTGGTIASLITSVAGSSAYFQGSIVSYSNEIKQKLLGVKKETLDTYGAVSEETVREMLAGLLHATGTDYGIAVSGIMGPDGGSVEKPVGTVWIAVGNKHSQRVQMLKQRFGRAKNIEVTSVMALNMLRSFILDDRP